jgi:hypothetical protein
MVSLVDDEKWVPLIGRLMLTFSQIEGITLNLLEKWSNPPIYQQLRTLPLKRRLSLLLELVTIQDHTEENKAFFNGLLTSLLPLLTYRNLVAHNPVSLVIMCEDDVTPLREGIPKSHTSQHVVEFDELRGVLHKAIAVKEGLYEAISRFRLEKLLPHLSQPLPE